MCVYFDDFFKNTSIFDITSKINELVKDKKVNTYLYEIFLTCVKYRRGTQFSGEFLYLRKKFITYCFFLLFEGKLWKKYEWEEIIEFCLTSYKGLNALKNIAKRERNLYYSRKCKE